MFSRSILLKTLLFISILLMTTLASPAAVPANEAAPGSSRLDSHLPDARSLTEECFHRSAGYRKLQPNAAPPKLKGACRCSCAINNCNTDADCGPGGLCLAAPSLLREIAAGAMVPEFRRIIPQD